MSHPIKFVIVDHYCGAGGLSEAAMLAIEELRTENPGVNIDVEHVAVNHWGIAIKTHSLNHPHAVQLCERIEALRPSEVIPDGIVDLLITAPECIYHSVARGDRPINDQRRSGAWTLHNWLSELYVKSLLVENVREFKKWGPLYPPDYHIKKLRNRPIPELKGTIFHAWRKGIQDMGYTTMDAEICCADNGDATTRVRWFLAGRRDGLPFSMGEATHASPTAIAKPSKDTLFPVGNREPWRTARNSVIDWGVVSKSIFDRDKPLVPNTLARIEAGLRKFNGPCVLPFIVALRHYMGQLPEIGPPAPIEVKGETCHIDPVQIVFRNHGDGVSIDDPVPTLCADGQHVGLAEPVLVKYYGTADAQSVDAPIGTVTGNDRFGLVEPIMVSYHNGPGCENRTRSIDSPLPTLDTSNRFGFVEPVIVNMKGQSIASGIDEPIPTQTATAYHLYKADAVLIPHQKFGQVHADSIDEPVRTIDATNGRLNGLAEPVIIPFFGERSGQLPRAHSVDEPCPTVTSHGAGGLVEAFLISVNHGNRCSDDNWRRTYSLDEPLKTITASRRGIALVIPIMERVDPNGPERRGYILVTPDGEYRIDINFRMLQWHELAAATSFPADYQFHGNQGDKVKQIGNAVPIRTGKRLCKAQLAPFIQALEARGVA